MASRPSLVLTRPSGRPRAAVVLLLASAACGGAESSEAGDGTRPVHSDGPAPATWTVATEPALRLGAAEGAEAEVFGWVAGAVRLSDGRIVVLDGQANELRFFDTEGGHLATHGRKGEGPGEFRNAIWLGRMPGSDTLRVWDIALDRLSEFSPAGEFTTSRRIELPPRLILSRMVGMTGSGAAVFRPRVLPAVRGGLSDSVVIVSVSHSGQVDTVAVEREEDLHSLPMGSMRMILPRPFGRNLLSAAGSSGVATGYNDEYRIAYQRSDGRRMEIRRDHPATEVTADLTSKLREHTIARYTGETRDAYERSFDLEPWPTAPAFSALEIDDLGRIWVRRYEWPWLQTATWDVFSPEGELLAEVEAPGQLDIYQIGEDFVLAKVEDDFGVDYVVLHGLRTSTPDLADAGGAP